MLSPKLKKKFLFGESIFDLSTNVLIDEEVAKGPEYESKSEAKRMIKARLESRNFRQSIAVQNTEKQQLHIYCTPYVSAKFILLVENDQKLDPLYRSGKIKFVIEE